MAKGVSILLLDPDGLLQPERFARRWGVHAFQQVDDAVSGLSFLEPEVVLTVLSDDGLAFARTVHGRHPDVPIVMVARAPAVGDVLRAMRVGVRDVVDLTDPSVAVGRALDVALAWRKSLHKGLTTALQESRAAELKAGQWIEALQERVNELEKQLAAEEGMLVQAQRELEVQRELGQAAVRARSRFLTRMSEELNTPLHAIVDQGELLREELEDPEARDQVVHIIALGRRLVSLLEDVTRLSKLEAGQVRPVFEPVSVRPLLKDVVDGLRPLARTGGVKLSIGKCGLEEVATDPSRLRQALMPIVDNAVRYSPGGRVKVSARREQGEPTSWAVFRVEDDGVGVAPGDLANIFDAFSQGGQSSGTGLGLAVARQLCRVLGGRLEAQSEPGKGSSFEIWVPDAAVMEVSETEDAELTLLVVDDDPVLRTLLQRMLVADGHSVVTTGSGHDAVELARQHQPALICLDVTLPGMDGFEVLEALKDDPAVSEIPVVMVSGDPEAGRARDLGAADVLPKPVSRKALRAVIAKHARREQPSGLLVVGNELPECLAPLAMERGDVRAVPAQHLADALQRPPGAIVLPADLDVASLRTALRAAEERAPEVPVIALIGALEDDDRKYLGARLAGVVSIHGDPSARLRRYATAQ